MDKQNGNKKENERQSVRLEVRVAYWRALQKFPPLPQ